MPQSSSYSNPDQRRAVARSERIASYDEFFDFYLMEHQSAASRRLHFLGTGLGTLALFLAVATGSWWLLLVALVLGYCPAWVGHFFVEHNRPATFRYPLWSLMSDYRMLWLWITGKLEPALQKARARYNGSDSRSG